MKRQVLISGASFAGLTLAYWLHKFGCDVTVIELGNDLRTGGSPIDVRGDALEIAREMGIYDQIKLNEFVHTDEIVNTDDQTLASFAINTTEEYKGDIEIHRGDLIRIIYNILPKDEVKIIFGDSITSLIQRDNHVEASFKKKDSDTYDFVFGADGAHSMVRKLIFGPEEKFKKFLGVYFAFAETNKIETGRPKSTGIVYREIGKQAVIYQFKNGANSILLFRSPELEWNYRDLQQSKKILLNNFAGNSNWKLPEILDAMIQGNDLYFDEACQIHMPAWTKGRVGLVGDAGYAPSFFTGMGTSLAMQGAALIAKELHHNANYQIAFNNYHEKFKPFVEKIQGNVNYGLKIMLPETEEDLQASYKAWVNDTDE